MQRLSVDEACALVDGQGYVYLDVRTVPEFDTGHLPGAYNVPWHEPGSDGARENPAFVEQVCAVLARGQGLVVGCASGVRSLAAAERLAAYGFARVCELRPGVEGVRDAFGRTREPGLRAAGKSLVSAALPGRSHADICASLQALRAVTPLPTRDERQMLWNIVRELPVSISFFRGPELLTECIHPVVVRNFGREIPELPYREAFPELVGLQYLPQLQEVQRSGRPIQVREARVDLPGRDGERVSTHWNYAYFPVPSADGVISCHVEVTAEVQAREKLAAVTRRYSSLIAATSQTVWTAAPDGTIVEDSPSWRAFTGQTRAQWLGHGWLDAVHPDDRALAAEAWARATSQADLYEVEYRVRRADGEYVWMVARGVPVRDDAGHVYEWMGTNTDVSERKCAEQERARAEAERAELFGRELKLREQAEAANRAKDEFLAMLGHELRNPLAPIVTALELMQLDAGEEQRDFATEREIITRHVRHLGRLVDDLLDVSRITRGRIELRKERVPLFEVVQRAVEMASPLLEERRHYLTVDVPRDALEVDGDPARLAQVVANLLTNAAKYTEPRGQIRVTATARDGIAELRVSDNGLGIPAAQLSAIFEPFVQQAQSLARSHGGLGLGLAIVRNLVGLHGGSVEAHSAGEGAGSVFVITLPLAVGRPVPIRPTAGSELAERLREPVRRVLVVDDNEDAANLLCAWLERRGHVTEVAHDAFEALTLAEDFAPDVALLDIGLPVLDGYELARRLLRLPGLAGLKLVAVTGYGQEEDRVRSARAGFHVHLVKPVNLPELAQVIQALTGDQAALAR